MCLSWSCWTYIGLHMGLEDAHREPRCARTGVQAVDLCVSSACVRYCCPISQMRKLRHGEATQLVSKMQSQDLSLAFLLSGAP